MNRLCLAAALGFPLLVGCAYAPVRDAASLSAAVANGGVGSPRLPLATDAGLDASWLQAPLTLERAVQSALQNNPRVRAELARLDAAQAERLQAVLLNNPVATLMALRPQGGGRFELEVGFMQSLFDLFARSRRVVVADAAQRRVEAEVALALVALAQDTEAAYYAWLGANERLRVRRALLALDEARLALLQREARLGLRPASAMLAQESVVSSRGHEAQDAEAGFSQARAALAQLLGLSSAQELRLPATPPADPMPDLDDTSLLALAARNQPELRAAEAAVDVARAERNLQTRGAGLSLGAIAARESDGMRLSGAGLEIVLPIFDTGVARRALADARIAEADAIAEAARRQVPLQVERALGSLVAARTALGHAERHLRQLEQLELLAERSYRLGATSLLSYQQASQARWLSALDRIEAQQTLWDAIVALERATGTATRRGSADGTEEIAVEQASSPNH